MTRLDYQSPAPPTRWRTSKLLWIGLATLVIGSGPLIVIILAAAAGLTADPNPNPVGLGMLAGCTFWPGIGLTIAGTVITLNNRQKFHRQMSLPTSIDRKGN